MIQTLSIVIFVLYVLATPTSHERFRNRLLWFIGAVLSVVGIAVSQKTSTAVNVVMLTVCALPLLLAIPHAAFRRD